MSNKAAHITAFALLVLSLFLMGMNAFGEEGSREDLEARKRDLQAQVATLKAEQDLLLFEKEFAEIDSKYLVLDIRKNTGYLKYRSRVFMDFPLTADSQKTLLAVPAGPQIVTRKIEGTKGQFALVFGQALVMRTKYAAGVAGIPVIILNRKEMRSIFYALEEGSRMYILP